MVAPVAVSSWLREALVSVPPWAIILALFLLFVGISVGCRTLVVRRCSDDRRAELAEHAGKLVTGMAASFAFFVGFAITMTWGAVSAGQAAVEDQAARAQQLVWVVGNISDEEAAHSILEELHTYLVTAANQDGPHLAGGDTRNLPSTKPLDTLQDSIHGYAFGPDSADPEVSGLVDAAADLNAAAASVSAVARRSLPPLVAVLLLVAGGLLAAIMGVSTAMISRPLFLPVWCLLPALAITVIPGPGGIEVDLSPLLVVAERMTG